MSTNQPFVSVVTPVYNCDPYIAECIESVLSQSYENFEYLIVNNCSNDNTLEIAMDYAKKDSRIRIRDNSEFLSVMVNHNNAVNQIAPDSKYCKVVSADDWIMRNCLTEMVEFASGHPDVGIIGSYSIEGKRVLFQGLDFSERVVNGREICRNTMLGTQAYVFGTPTSLLYRSDLVRRTKTFFPYPEDAPHADVSASIKRSSTLTSALCIRSCLIRVFMQGLKRLRASNSAVNSGHGSQTGYVSGPST